MLFIEMDRRSWLWRRRSSEKSPVETESSGSLSSYSEKLSDDQAYSNLNAQSPEVTSKATSGHKESSDAVKTLTEKLSAALLNISAKEDLVKQHRKVAEEAVLGWENAENEVLSVKQNLEVTIKKNLVLEDRVSHLDGALKECVRQLRQASEDQEHKIQEAVVKKSHEWENLKSEFETHVVELQAQLETAKAKSSPYIDLSELRLQRQNAQKEISNLKLEFHCRDLSAKAAETASKQHLEGIQNVSKLEINFMDDFLEMEKLAALPHIESSCFRESESEAVSNHPNEEIPLRFELDNMIYRTTKLKERLEKTSREKVKLGISLSKCQEKLQESQGLFKEAELKLVGLQKQLAMTCKLKNVIEKKLVSIDARRETAELSLSNSEAEVKTLLLKVESLEKEVEKEKALSVENANKCRKLKDGLSRIKHESELKLDLERESKNAVINKMEATDAKREIAESQLLISESNFKKLLLKVGALEEEVEKEKALTAETLQAEFSKLKHEEELKMIELQRQLAIADEMKIVVEQKLNTKREIMESQLIISETNVKNLISKASSLEDDIKKEKILSENKCRKLQDELFRFKLESMCTLSLTNGELKLKQEKELAVATSKFAECQQTIASLGQQLQSLAALEDFM